MSNTQQTISTTKRLKQQIDFMREIDKLKTILRRSYLLTEKRHENSAEHSWHAALMSIILAEYANDQIDSLRVMKMLLIHDIVEIDAGDTFLYDTKGVLEQNKKEMSAAKRIFNLLPEDLAEIYLKLWIEFETQESNDAKFAKAIDRVMPILHNYFTEGLSWKEHNITVEQALQNKNVINNGSKELWKYIESIIMDAREKGYLR